MGNFEDIGGSDFNTPTERIKPSVLNENNNLLASWINSLGITFKNQAQLIFNNEYNSWANNLNVNGEPNLKNIEYDVFTSNNAYDYAQFSYNSTDDLYETIDFNTITEDENYYGVVIVAEDNSLKSGTINNCSYIKIDSGKWLLYSTDTDKETARAQVFKTLFYGTSENPFLNNFTSITALKTSESDDVGTLVKYTYLSYSQTENPADRDPGHVFHYSADFSDSSNNNVSIWTDITVGGQDSDGYPKHSVQCPDGTTIESQSASSNGVNKIGTDTSDKEKSNPDSFVLRGSGYTDDSGSNSFSSKTIVAWTSGTLPELTLTKDNETIFDDRFTINEYTENNFSGVPAFTLQDNDIPDNAYLILRTTSLPEIKDCIATWNSEIDSENTLTVSISADGTNYEEVTDATIHRFTDTGTNLYVKFEIDRVDTSAIDKISEYAILYNLIEEDEES
ncbi:MAG: hypothetical protein ACOC5T_01720 [Elusimicrobiota bacterium]